MTHIWKFPSLHHSSSRSPLQNTFLVCYLNEVPHHCSEMPKDSHTQTGRDEVLICGGPWTKGAPSLGSNFAMYPMRSFHHIFSMWTIFKVFVEFVTILFLLYVSVFQPQGMWDHSSPTRDQTCSLCTGSWRPNHWTAREVPQYIILTGFLERSFWLPRVLNPFSGSVPQVNRLFRVGVPWRSHLSVPLGCTADLGFLKPRLRSVQSQLCHLTVVFGLDLLFPFMVSEHGWRKQKTFPSQKRLKAGLVCDPPELRGWTELGASVPRPTIRVQLHKEKPDLAITEWRLSDSGFNPSVLSNRGNGRIKFPVLLAFDNIYWVTMSAVRQLV